MMPCRSSLVSALVRGQVGNLMLLLFGLWETASSPKTFLCTNPVLSGAKCIFLFYDIIPLISGCEILLTRFGTNLDAPPSITPRQGKRVAHVSDRRWCYDKYVASFPHSTVILATCRALCWPLRYPSRSPRHNLPPAPTTTAVLAGAWRDHMHRGLKTAQLDIRHRVTPYLPRPSVPNPRRPRPPDSAASRSDRMLYSALHASPGPRRCQCCAMPALIVLLRFARGGLLPAIASRMP